MAYTVQPGDTFGRIAKKLGTTVAALRKANPGLADINHIAVGQRLEVPASPAESPQVRR